MEHRLTGDACVEALIRAGFRIRNGGNGIAILMRGPSMVMIPDVEVVEEPLLQAILRSAGMTKAELDAQLKHKPTRSGFFTTSQTPKPR